MGEAVARGAVRDFGLYGSSARADACVTCGDIAIPAIITSLFPDQLADACTDDGALLEQISVALVEATVGSRVLVHADEAICLIEETALRFPIAPETATPQGGSDAR